MKKVYFATACSVALLLGSCKTGETENITRACYPVYSLITNMKDGTTQAVPSAYYFEFNFTKENVKLWSDIKIGNTVHSFISQETTYSNSTYDGGQLIRIGKVTADWDMDATKSLENFKCDITSLTNSYDANVEGVPRLNQEQSTTLLYPAIVLSFGVPGEYVISSFPIAAWYAGTTTTTFDMGGGPSSYTDKKTVYRVALDVAEKKASVVMYEARFAQNMPALPAIILEDLPLSFANGTYSIDAENIIPKVAEGGGLTEYPSYTFDEFHFSPDGQEKADIAFKVAGKFSGSFKGSWLSQNL